jgi:flagellum-specific ATP synthase
MKPPASTHWQWPTVDAGVRDDRWARFLGDLKTFASLPQPLQTEGTLVRVTGLVLEATGLRLPVGSVCDVIGTDAQPVQAEVVGFHGDRCFLMPTGEIIGLASGARVVPRPVPQLAPRFGHENRPWRRSEDRGLHLPMGEGLLGRVVDAHGRPLDPPGAMADVRQEPLVRRPINAMDRDPVREPLDTGVRAIDTLLTVGRGQRLGLFAGTGVGKSVLLGMMARYTAADVIVVGLIAAARSRSSSRTSSVRKAASAASSSPHRPTRRRWSGCREPTTRPRSPSTSAIAGDTCCC